MFFVAFSTGSFLSATRVASGWIFVLMLLITLDIVLRFAFNAPLSGTTEIVEISIVTILYLQLAHTLKVGRVTRSDALFGAILRKWPAIGHLMGVFLPSGWCRTDGGDRLWRLAEMDTGL